MSARRARRAGHGRGVHWRSVAWAALAPIAWPLWMGAAPERAPRRHVVEVRGFEFRPQTLEVAVGDTVVWVNRDLVPHTATATDESWDSGPFGKDGSWSYVPSEPGEQEYLCALHPVMKGRLIVKER
ncbi:MAG TPA: cupredoxin family copper-binding protein [Longimicrobiales bacterium]